MIPRRSFLAGVASLPAGAVAMPTAPPDSRDAALIAECARVEGIARREHQAWRRLAETEARFRAASPPRPIIPLSDRVPDSETLKLLRARVSTLDGSTHQFAAEDLEALRDRIERLEAYNAERAALAKRLRVDAAVEIAERWNERLIAAARELAVITPFTREGLRAKALTWLRLRRLAPRDMSFEWANDLAEMTIREVVMFGPDKVPATV